MEMGMVTHMSLNDACAREHWPALDGQCRCVRRMEKLEASAFACAMHATVFYTGFAVHSVFFVRNESFIVITVFKTLWT